jgi:hypothetical protein
MGQARVNIGGAAQSNPSNNHRLFLHNACQRAPPYRTLRIACPTLQSSVGKLYRPFPNRPATVCVLVVINKSQRRYFEREGWQTGP